jgi:signal peptidase I
LNLKSKDFFDDEIMKIMSALFTVFIVFLILPIIATMVPTGPVKFQTITGSSMEPNIISSDIVVINTANTQPAVGDIVSYHYKLPSSQIVSITHRVVKVVKEGYITKGDALALQDNYVVAPKDVIGIMFFKVPFIGALIHFARTGKGLLIFVMFPAIILILQEVYEISGQLKYNK